MRRQHRPFICVTLLAILVMSICAGCAKKTTSEEEQSLDEQLYVDAEHGFTVLHPLSWKRQRLPVSSPNYRKDSITWKIPDTQEPGTMLIRVYPEAGPSSGATDLIEAFLASRPEHSAEEAVPFKHTAGEAVSMTVYYPNHSERLYVIRGEKNVYLLSFSLNSEAFDEQLSQFDRIAKSLREF